MDPVQLFILLEAKKELKTRIKFARFSKSNSDHVLEDGLVTHSPFMFKLSDLNVKVEPGLKYVLACEAEDYSEFKMVLYHDLQFSYQKLLKSVNG